MELTQDATASGATGAGGRFSHEPVLLRQTIELLQPQRGGCYVDATLGLGGHSFEVARRLGCEGHLIGFDRDAQALEMARQRLCNPPAELAGDWPRITLINEAFSGISGAVAAGSADGVLADIGVSSLQLDDATRGFSFQAEGPLDMRMDQRSGVTAYEVVNQFGEKELADLLYEYADERRSRRIARAVVRARPITSTAHLAQVISAALPYKTKGSGKKIHPATLSFQAIRIFVNRELDELAALLSPAGAVKALKPGGRLAVISFHSLEDRMVKDAMRDGAKAHRLQILTKKPVVAEEEEMWRNPRSRSAKLRVAVKLK